MNYLLILQAGELRQAEEITAALFHTLLFHRSLGKFHYKQEGSYSVGTVGFKDVDCDFIDVTYVRCAIRHWVSCSLLLLLCLNFKKHVMFSFIGTVWFRSTWPSPQESYSCLHRIPSSRRLWEWGNSFGILSEKTPTMAPSPWFNPLGGLDAQVSDTALCKWTRWGC